MARLTPQEIQLAEIRAHIADRRKDAADAQRRAAEHLAEAAESSQLADRWEVVHDAVRFGVVPNLDGCLGPDTEEVPF